jgi:probable phosphoglycerate mutase
MTDLVLLRHAVTEWNLAHRIQGHTDVPLAERGRRDAAGWRLPAEFGGFAWLASPLARAVETARLMGAPADLPTDRRLRERSWGAFEGRTRPEIDAAHPGWFEAAAARGLDARPPDGESPRDLIGRLLGLTAEIAAAGRPTVAVCHRGVIQAVYAAATGWDYCPPMPHRLEDACCFHFHLAADGRPAVVALNLPLAP